jgi:hypothetical protein
LHDAGRGGGNGSADLLTVDHTGMVWLIEVKFNFSLESGVQVWHNQLARYRKALMTMEWRQIVAYTHQFLLGNENTKPQLALRLDALSLEECIADWLVAIKIDPAQSAIIISKMAERLRTGHFGIMLLSDYSSKSDLDAAISFASMEHKGPVAYAVIAPDATGFKWKEQYFRPAINQYSLAAPYIASDFLPEKMPLITPSRLRTLVSLPCRDLLDKVIYPRLSAMGWDERHAPKHG